MKARLLLFLLGIFLAVGCSSAKNYGSGKMYKKNVTACFYADKFNGRKTASGVTFSNNKFTAAHKKLPFGTKVRVTNLSNNKSVVVEINDRGPFSGGFEIDMAKKAYQEISDPKSRAKMRVNIEILK